MMVTHIIGFFAVSLLGFLHLFVFQIYKIFLALPFHLDSLTFVVCNCAVATVSLCCYKPIMTKLASSILY